MFSRRKPLAIVLTVVFLLAMLAPAATAAPEYVHGVQITKPTEAAPAYVYPADDNTFQVSYKVTVVDTQVDNVAVNVLVFNAYQVIADNFGQMNVHVPGEVKNGAITGSFTIAIDEKISPPDGWYDVKVCARDEWSNGNEWGPFWCATEHNAVLIERTFPRVDLIKPEWEAAATGQQYLLVGAVLEHFGITKVEFQYCDISNSPSGCTKGFTETGDQDVWVTIASTADKPPTVKKTDPPPIHMDDWVQYEATWDSSKVPDEWPWEYMEEFPAGYGGGQNAGALIRMCAWNLVGLSNCYDPDYAAPSSWEGWATDPRPDAHKIFVNNHYWIGLEAGWNLISTPLMLYNPNIEVVLAHLGPNVKQVATRVWDGSKWVWQTWAPGAKAPKSLTQIVDGQGYWVNMTTEDLLTLTGTWASMGPVAPPEYAVYDGWNLIGYTQYGRPLWKHSKFAMEYFGPGVHPYVQALWRYDAGAYRYKQVLFDDDMVKGAGYWLAVIQDGRINP